MNEGLGKRAERVYCHLVREIDEGRLQPGRRLPTQQELSHQFKVSRSTVQSAIHRLVAEGRVAAVRGSGMFVREFDKQIAYFDNPSWVQSVGRFVEDEEFRLVQ